MSTDDIRYKTLKYTVKPAETVRTPGKHEIIVNKWFYYLLLLNLWMGILIMILDWLAKVWPS